MILKKISSKDLNLSSNELEKSFNTEAVRIPQRDDFKARLFAFYFKNIKTKCMKFKPIGVSFDEERIPDWKVFLVLMDYSDNNKEKYAERTNKNKIFEVDHKLVKVCYPEKNLNIVFAIVLNFDKSCLDYVNLSSSVDLLSENSTEDTIKFKNFQNSLMDKDSSLSENFINGFDNINSPNPPLSFLEKSQNVSEKISSYKANFNDNRVKEQKENGKTFGLDSLVSKFSVEELNKIKSLIKFAKKNKIMDDIYKKKGEMSLSDLANAKSYPPLHIFNNDNKIIDMNSADARFINIIGNNSLIFII